RSRYMFDDQVALHVLAGREREAAVPHDDCRHAVPAGAAAQGIPEHLRVHVRVPVDEAGSDDLAGRVYLFLAALGNAAYGRDSIAAYREVCSDLRQSGSLDYRPVADHEIVHASSLWTRQNPGIRPADTPPDETITQPPAGSNE